MEEEGLFIFIPTNEVDAWGDSGGHVRWHATSRGVGERCSKRFDEGERLVVIMYNRCRRCAIAPSVHLILRVASSSASSPPPPPPSPSPFPIPQGSCHCGEGRGAITSMLRKSNGARCQKLRDPPKRWCPSHSKPKMRSLYFLFIIIEYSLKLRDSAHHSPNKGLPTTLPKLHCSSSFSSLSKL